MQTETRYAVIHCPRCRERLAVTDVAACSSCGTSFDQAAGPVRGYRLMTLGSLVIAAIGLVMIVRVLFGLQVIIELDANTSSVAILQLTLVNLAANLLAGALFITWLWRAWTNASEDMRAKLTMGRGWTVGSWFVPLANIVLPYFSVKEIVRATVDNPYVRIALPVWWVTFAGAQIVAAVGEFAGELELTLIVSQLLLSVAALGAAVLVYAVSSTQDRRLGHKPAGVWRMAAPAVASVVLAGIVGGLCIDLNPTPRPVSAQRSVEAKPTPESAEIPYSVGNQTTAEAVPPATMITLAVPAKLGNRQLVETSVQRTVHYLDNPYINFYSQVSAEYGSQSAGNRMWIVAGTSGELTDLEWNMYLLPAGEQQEVLEVPPGPLGGLIRCVVDSDIHCVWTNNGVVGMIVWYDTEDYPRALREIHGIRAQIERRG